MTFAPAQPRARKRMSNPEAPLETYICQWSYNSNIRKECALGRDANVRIGPLAQSGEFRTVSEMTTSGTTLDFTQRFGSRTGVNFQ